MKQSIKCDGDAQKVTLVKMIGGFPTIVRKHYKDVNLTELNSQNTGILNDMMGGHTMTRKRAETKHGCVKMLTRMSEIRTALLKHGIKPIELTYKSSRGKNCKNFRLTKEQINKLETL